MIDTLNIRLSYLDSPNTDFLAEIPCYLEQVSEHQFADGQVALCGYLDSLKVSVSRLGVGIKEGSFCKWCKGTNFKVMGRKDIQEGLEKLSDRLHLPMGIAQVFRVDIAQNFILKHPVSIYTNHLGALAYHTRLEAKDGLYYSGTNTQLCYYDKVKEQRKAGAEIPELYSGKPVLRYEYRLKSRLPHLLNTCKVQAQMLCDEAVYMQLVNMWLQGYRDIRKINETTINFEQMKSVKDLQRAGLLTLIEQRGGQVAILKEIDEGYKSGRLSKKQAFDLRGAINRVCQIDKESLITKSEAVEELSKKVEQAARYYR